MVTEDEFQSLLGDIAKLSERDVHDIWIPTLQKNVKFTSITVKQQKDLMTSGLTPRMKDVAFVNCINNIITTNCKEDVNITTIDRPLIILQLRIMAVSNTIPLYIDGVRNDIDLKDHVDKTKHITISEEISNFNIETSNVKVECVAPDLKKDIVLNDTFTSRVGTDTNVDLTKTIGDVYVFELVKYIKTVTLTAAENNIKIDFDEEKLSGEQMLQVFESLPMEICNKMVDHIEKIKAIENQQLFCDQLQPPGTIPIQADIFTGD